MTSPGPAKSRGSFGAVFATCVLAVAVALLAGCGGGSRESDPGEVDRDQPQAKSNIVLLTSDAALTTSGKFEAVAGYLSQSRRVLCSVDPKATATFDLRVQHAGHYEVFAWWPQALPASGTASVTVQDLGGETTLTVDQRGMGGQWNSLGMFRLQPGKNGRITFRSAAATPLHVDAVRLRFVGLERPPVALRMAQLPVGFRDSVYEAHLGAWGGAAPYTYVVSGGNLPNGLRLDRHTGRVSGRLAEVGRFAFEVTVTDSAGSRAVESLAIEVTASIGSEEGAHGQAPNTSTQQREKPMATAPDLSNLLNILAAMPEGGWRRINVNNYSDVWAPADLRPLFGWGNPTPSKIVAAWSSFAWDSNRGTILLYGGGHANYRGNDVYLWRASTQRWERAALPSEMVQDSLGNWNAVDGADKAPASAHTYDNTLFFPVIDRLVVFGGAADANGGHYLRKATETTSRKTGLYLFDPSRAHPDKVGGSTGSHVRRVAPYPQIVGGDMWSNRENWLNAASETALPKEAYVNGCTAYAAESGKDVAYVRTSSGLYRYAIHDVSDASTDSWQRVGVHWSGAGGKTTCGIDRQRRVLVRTGTNAAPFTYWDLNTASPSNRDVRFTPNDPTGEFPALLSSNAISLPDCGMDFDWRRGNFGLWCGDGRVWNLKPPQGVGPSGWTISKSVTPGTPVPNGDFGTGILGKWKYIDSLDAFIGLQDAVLGNVWLYKPVGWTNPSGGNLPPATSISSPTEGSSFGAGGSISIIAAATDVDGFVAKVEFFSNGEKIGEDSSSPYSMTWLAVSTGTYDLTVIATDDAGVTAASSPVRIVVVTSNTPPTVEMTQPVQGASFATGSVITVAAAASDSDGTVSKVEFFDGATKIGEDAVAPYAISWSGASAGSHQLTAAAIDDKGARTVSTEVGITVASSGDGSTVELRRGVGSAQVADTYLSDYHPSLGFGASTAMLDYLGHYSVLMRFSIFQSEGGPVPDGATIRSAVLSLYKYSYYDMTYGVHRMLIDWSEATATWNQRSPGMAWSAAGAGGAGSDYAVSPDATGSGSWNPGWVTFDVTAAVQQMSGSATAVNYGWRIKGINGYTTAIKRFYSSEHASDASLRPRLVVTYD